MIAVWSIRFKLISKFWLLLCLNILCKLKQYFYDLCKHYLCLFWKCSVWKTMHVAKLMAACSWYTSSGNYHNMAMTSLFSFTSPAVKRLLGWKQGRSWINRILSYCNMSYCKLVSRWRGREMGWESSRCPRKKTEEKERFSRRIGKGAELPWTS